MEGRHHPQPETALGGSGRLRKRRQKYEPILRVSPIVAAIGHSLDCSAGQASGETLAETSKD